MHNNTSQHRFELDVEGHTIFADYRRDGDVFQIMHVETPAPLRGKGAAGELLREIAEEARAQGWTLVPVCSYAVAWMQKHPEYRDLLA